MKKTDLKSKIKTLNKVIDRLSFEKNDLYNTHAKTEKELKETLKTFDEIRDELTYYKGFHDGVKNGAKVNFSPTINQSEKKQYPSGGDISVKEWEKNLQNDYEKAVNIEKSEFNPPEQKEPRPETVEKVLSFSEAMKKVNENIHKLVTPPNIPGFRKPPPSLLKMLDKFLGDDNRVFVVDFSGVHEVAKDQPKKENPEFARAGNEASEIMSDEVKKLQDDLKQPGDVNIDDTNAKY